MFTALAFATPASAQFGLFGGGASPQDVYDTVASHGFRMAGPLYKNGNVYVADVYDRRRRRERLIISADSGEIVQRFFVDLAGPARVVPQPRPDDFFSRLVRGWNDDDPPPRPPVGVGNEAVMPLAPLRPREPRPRPAEPRIVTRTEEAPITAAPLPASPGPRTAAPPAANAGPEGVKPTSTPTPADNGSAPAGGTRATTVVRDPLRIPGERDAGSAKGAAVAATKTPVPLKLPAAKPADVPVAPLD